MDRMEEELLAFLNSHGSCRKFTGREISEEQERLIAATAQRSPTSSNLQAYSIVAVRDRGRKARLAELAGNQAHVAACPLFLVFCADLHRLSRLNEARGYPFHGGDLELLLVATVDAALAAGRALLAAQAMGFGGVMVGGVRNHPADVCDLLGLPRLVYPVMGMSLGEPAEPPKVKPRLPLAAVLFREEYSDRDFDLAVAEYDDTLDRLGYLRARPVEPERYPGFSGRYTWSEHTARRLASEDPQVRRPHLEAFLRERGLLRS